MRVAGLGTGAAAAMAAVPLPGAQRSGLDRPGRRRRWLVPLGLAGAALAGLALAAGLWLLPILSDLQAARGQLVAGAALLQEKGFALTAADRRHAEDEFASADRLFRRAGAHLADGPLAGTLAHLPVARTQLRAAHILVDIGRRLAHAGTVSVSVANAVRAQAEAHNAGHLQPAQEFMALNGSLDPQLSVIDHDLRQAAGDRAQVAHAFLLPPLAKAFAQLDERLGKVRALVGDLRSLEAGLPQIFGASGPRTYLVLQQDPAEVRGTGGFIGSIAFLSFDHGRMAPYQPQDVYAVDNAHTLGQQGGPRYVPPPPPFTRLIQNGSWELRDANWSPDFPTAARQAEFLYQRETGRTVDGVIAIDPHLVASILEITGPVFIPETHDTVTAQNFFARTLERVELHTPGTPKKAFLSFAARPIVDRLFRSTKWTAMLSMLGRSCQARWLQAYFNDPAAEAMVNQLACSVRLQPLRGDGVMVVDSNLGGTKDDFYVRRSFWLDMRVQPDGTVVHTLYLHYDGLPAIPGVTSSFIDWLRIYLPASVTGVRVQGATLGEREEFGRRVMEGWVTFLEGQSASIVLTYETPRPPGPRAGQIDVLWQKQAGRVADPIQLRITLPAGWRLAETSGSRNLNGQVVATSLATDRTFSFRYSSANH